MKEDQTLLDPSKEKKAIKKKIYTAVGGAAKGKKFTTSVSGLSTSDWFVETGFLVPLQVNEIIRNVSTRITEVWCEIGGTKKFFDVVNIEKVFFVDDQEYNIDEEITDGKEVFIIDAPQQPKDFQKVFYGDYKKEE